MRTLMRLLLGVSSFWTLGTLSSCNDDIIDHLYNNGCVIINATDSDIRFFSDSTQCFIEVDCGDSVSYKNSKENKFWAYMYMKATRVNVGKDSTITLSDSDYSCWRFNCQNTKIGPYEWIHTYVIDDQWLKDAWIESKTGECPPGAKHNWYD